VNAALIYFEFCLFLKMLSCLLALDISFDMNEFSSFTGVLIVIFLKNSAVLNALVSNLGSFISFISLISFGSVTSCLEVGLLNFP
jgi:hypothetical protein